MSSPGAHHDVFRLLSLRGAADDLASDPSDGEDVESRRDATRRRHVVSAVTTPSRSKRDPRRAELDKARAHLAKINATIPALEAVQSKVYRTIATEGSADNHDLLDAKFYAALEGKLSEEERAVFDERVGSDPASRPVSLGDLQDRFDVQVDIRVANGLCSQIHVFAEELKLRLPTARPAEGERRPAIRALGWGDLVVVRERLVGYAANEIAHIENVLAGEKKSREHERLRRTEQLEETETTKGSESERDLQTSERFELQVEAQKTVDTEFSVQTGVNTSGRYGLTKVDTSLNAGFHRSVSESQQRTSELAKEVVSRAIDKVQESVRELRRRLTIEQIRELSKHTIDNRAIAGSTDVPEHRVGLYYWVEKIHQLELRQYGTRLMVEFHIPEPGVSLLEHKDQPVVDVRKPAPLAFGPQDISATNYMCLTERYGAQEVEPPPMLFRQVGFAWGSEVLESADEHSAEDTVAKMVKIPDGYAPFSGRVVVTGRGVGFDDKADVFHAQVSIGGFTVLDSPLDSGKPTYTKAFAFTDSPPVDNEGLPVTARIAAHHDRTATLNVAITCRRTSTLLQRWQLHTYERIREAHALLERDYRDAVEQAGFEQSTMIDISGRPSTQNRQLEREELKKWAIKTLRVVPFDFDAVVDEDGISEIDPIASDHQAPAVRFYEEAFEWPQMSYFLYPYFWGRRSAWAARSNVRVASDPLHETFLRAGSAKLIVPVTPGYEDRVLQYLESDPNLPESERIPMPTDDTPPDTQFPDLWLELLLNRREELALGDGTLSVTQGSADVGINDNEWKPSTRDIGRELFIAGATYEVAAFAEDSASFTLDRLYEGDTNPAIKYATGSVPFGSPWLARMPTALVVLSDDTPADVFES